MQLAKKILIIPKGNENKIININDIIYCKADLGYTQIFIVNNTSPICFSKNLKQLEKLLPGNQFLRCHQSYLVNKQYISSFSIIKHYIKLTQDIKIKLSRRKHQELREFLTNKK